MECRDWGVIRFSTIPMLGFRRDRKVEIETVKSTESDMETVIIRRYGIEVCHYIAQHTLNS